VRTAWPVRGEATLQCSLDPCRWKSDGYNRKDERCKPVATFFPSNFVLNMPEGPEIRQATDALNKVLAKQRVVQLRFGQPRLKPFERRFKNASVLHLEPKGKAILTHFDNGHSIYSHNQLYGEWAIFNKNAEPSSHKQRRIIIDTENHRAVLYSASDIDILKTEFVGTHPYIIKLGVELLNPNIRSSNVLQTLQAPRWQNKSIAQLLLDQAFLSGVGNYLRSEILFAAKLAPFYRLHEMDDGRKKQLAIAALKITRQAYKTFGVTNDLTRAKKLKAAGLAFSAYRHHVFDRDEAACWTCNTQIDRIMNTGRQLYWCSGCQR
jgi:endonuclease VIII